MDFIERFRDHRPLLWFTSLLGLVGLNGVFLYFAFARPGVLGQALANPIGLVFILEAMLVTLGGAWVIRMAGLERPGWVAFLFMTVVGSLAFSIPGFILAHLHKETGST